MDIHNNRYFKHQIIHQKFFVRDDLILTKSATLTAYKYLILNKYEKYLMQIEFVPGGNDENKNNCDLNRSHFSFTKLKTAAGLKRFTEVLDLA